MTEDQEFADALSYLWQNRLRARTKLDGETFIMAGRTKYERVTSNRGRSIILDKAEAKRLRKAAKRAKDMAR